MLARSFVKSLVVAGVLLVGTLPVGTHSSVHAQRPTKDWIRKTNKNLEICLRGEVVDPAGRPVTDIVVGGGISATAVSRPLMPLVKDNRFELWIPVNQRRWYSMWLRVASRDGSLVQYRRMTMFEIRQAAIDGIKLTLERPSRELEVKVTDEGEGVPNAMVKAELGYGIELRERTNAEGIAVFGLLGSQTPRRFTAWTNDYRVGGFSFNRKPTRDPNEDRHELELSQCRDQKLRFVDQSGSPVPGVTFLLQMAAMPNYNYIGTNEHSRCTTDENGEVLYRWFPDWDRHHFYPEFQTNAWVQQGNPEFIDGVALLKLKKGADRKTVPGRIAGPNKTNAGGFFITLRSFQGEREHQSDILSGFSNIDGHFSFDVLPDATYCTWMLDSKWAGEVSHLIPFESSIDEVTSPEITVLPGHPVEVIATTGESEMPYANLGISFRREHQYSWREDGRTRNGNSGPQWSATTDADGIARTVALPGELTASVFTPMWRSEAKVDIISGKVPAIIRLHRKLDQKRTVTGQVVLANTIEANLEDAQIKVGSVDGDYDDQRELLLNQDGSFSFETFSTKVGLFVSTQDGLAAGGMIVEKLDSPIELRLRPTMEYRGRLLGEGDQPLAGHSVWASVQLAGETDYSRRASFSTTFEAKRIETKTDPQGNYTLSGLPSEMKVNIRAHAVDDPKRTRYLDEVYLQSGENRPLAVSRLAESSKTAPKPLAKRYEETLRNCALMGFHVMIITSADDKSASDFVDDHFVDRQRTKEVSTFMQIALVDNAASLTSEDRAFLSERKYPLADAGHVFACAIDARGEELGRLELNIGEEGAAEKAARFVKQHAPEQRDAEKVWIAAFDEAKSSQRKVWARISQRYCGPCFRMARWLDDNRELLAKDYVMLKIDNVRDQNGAKVAKRLTRGGQFGVPFHAIFDDEQSLLVDSEGPLGNVGHPSGFEGKKHLRSMLLQTREHLSDAEIERIVDSLDD